jgi:uridine kinase
MAAVDFITELILRKLKMYHSRPSYIFDEKIYEIPNHESTNIILLERTPLLSNLMAILLNEEINEDDFMIYSNHLIASIWETCLQELDHHQMTNVLSNPICGICITLSGTSRAPSLSEMIKNVEFGEIFIQINSQTDEINSYQYEIPTPVQTSKVILIHTILTTSTPALMAIQILMDHHISQENIILLTLIATKYAILPISHFYSKIRILIVHTLSDTY